MEICAVCAIPQRDCGKFRAPADEIYNVHRMYVNVPGQYNIVTSIKPRKGNNYNRTYTEELGAIIPLNDNHDSDDDFQWKVDDNEVGVDEHYNVKYDQDDSSESTPPNRNLNLSKEDIDIDGGNNVKDNNNTVNGDAKSGEIEVIEIDIDNNDNNTKNKNDKVSE